MTDERRVVTAYLIVRADGDLRVTKGVRGGPRLRLDEVAFPIRVKIPPGWGRISELELDLRMPAPPDPTVVEQAGRPRKGAS